MDWFGEEQEERNKEEREREIQERAEKEERAEREKKQSKPIQTKVKVATICISMHGEALLTKPILSSNTVISSSVGLCQVDSLDLKEKIDRINYARSIYSKYPISQANSLYIKNVWNPFKTAFALNLKSLLTPSFSEDYPNESRIDIARRYLKSYSEEDFIRSYTTDKKYTIESDGSSELFMGVYFIHSNIPMSEFHTTCDDLIPDKSNKIYVQLQRYNLLNEDYAKRIAKMITGVPYSLNYFDHTSQMFRGIKKSNTIYLSSIIYYFKKLGFDHVNIIDHSCNVVYTETPPSIQREISTEQKTRGKQLTKTLGFGGKRKTTRHNHLDGIEFTKVYKSRFEKRKTKRRKIYK